jgi:hypothetical protein
MTYRREFLSMYAPIGSEGALGVADTVADCASGDALKKRAVSSGRQHAYPRAIAHRSALVFRRGHSTRRALQSSRAQISSGISGGCSRRRALQSNRAQIGSGTFCTQISRAAAGTAAFGHGSQARRRERPVGSTLRGVLVRERAPSMHGGQR